MLSIDINELLNYSICSYKHVFPKKDTQLKSYIEVRSYLYSKIFDYCLYLKSNYLPLSLSKIDNQLNYSWNDIKNNLGYKLSISEKLSIKTNLIKFLDLFKSIDTVVYYALPVEVYTDKGNIFFDIYSYYQEGELKTVSKINITQYSLKEDSFPIQLAASIVKSGVKTLDDRLRHNVYIFKTDTINLYKYNKKINLEKVNILNNIFNGIDNKVFIPKNDYVTCHNCSHRLECSWSSSNQ